MTPVSGLVLSYRVSAQYSSAPPAIMASRQQRPRIGKAQLFHRLGPQPLHLLLTLGRVQEGDESDRTRQHH